MRIRTLLTATLFAAMAFSCSSTPAKKAAAAAPGFGDPVAFSVGRIDSVLLHDAKREKDLDVAIEYPKAAGPFPVIVFSHAFGATKESYRPLIQWWAGHGYVVIQPTHADSGAISDVRELLGTESVWETQNEIGWRNRARDIVLVIDSLGDLEHRNFELRGKIDASRVGVGGHSFGAFTTMLVAGTKAAAGNGTVMVRDARVKAGLAMSPQGVSSDRGLSEQSWSDVSIPMMYMSGTLDRGAMNQKIQWRRDPYTFSPAGDKYLVWISGARHLSFTGRFEDLPQMESGYAPTTMSADPGPRDDPRDPTSQSRRRREDYDAQRRNGTRGPNSSERLIFATVRRTSLAFWDAYLKNDAKAKEYLISVQAHAESRVKVEILAK